jgi:hypothetical protein
MKRAIYYGRRSTRKAPSARLRGLNILYHGRPEDHQGPGLAVVMKGSRPPLRSTCYSTDSIATDFAFWPA